MNVSVVPQLNGDCYVPNGWKGCAIEHYSTDASAVGSSDELPSVVRTDWRHLVTSDESSVY